MTWYGLIGFAWAPYFSQDMAETVSARCTEAALVPILSDHSAVGVFKAHLLMLYRYNFIDNFGALAGAPRYLDSRSASYLMLDGLVEPLEKRSYLCMISNTVPLEVWASISR